MGRGIIAFVVLCCALKVTAAPWLDPGESDLRHHLQVLNDSGHLRTPITTWPVMWGSVMAAVETIDKSRLNSQQRWSLQHIQFVFQQQARPGLRGSARLNLASEYDSLDSFDQRQREEGELTATVDWVGERWAARLQGSYADDPIDGKKVRADGSFIAYLAGNWSLGAGAIDRWWGPGWQSSLIWSDNARPIPGLTLQRNRADAFITPWLSWLGPWQFVMTAGQLESERHIPDAKHLGARLSFQPLPGFEVALTRTAQWGGEGRPQSLSNLVDLVLGKDNFEADDPEKDKEPGNQLGGIDFRYGFAWGDSTHALYYQYTGEDESNMWPSRAMGLAGVETSFLWRDSQHRLILEYENTTAEFYGDETFNYAYEHSIYLTGYRYRGRPIGSSLDNDSQRITLTGQHYLANGHQLIWSVADVTINEDGSNSAPPRGNVYGAERSDLKTVELDYRFPVGDHTRVSIGAFYYSEPLQIADKEVDSGARISVEFRL